MKKLSTLYRINGYVMMFCIVAYVLSLLAGNVLGIVLGAFGFFASMYAEKSITNNMRRFLSEDIKY